MSLTIRAGELVVKDPNEVAVYSADWGTETLAAGVELEDEGTFIIAPNDGDLSIDEEAIEDGNRSVLFRVSGGRKGRRYRIAHRVVTNETPAQTKEQSFYLLVADR